MLDSIFFPLTMNEVFQLIRQNLHSFIFIAERIDVLRRWREKSSNHVFGANVNKNMKLICKHHYKMNFV